MRTSLRWSSCLAVVAALSISSAARADEPSAADVGAARAMGQEGVKLAEAGNCAEAVEKLSRAEKLFHAPTTLFHLGDCQVKLGKVVEGTENLNRVVREELAPNAPKAFKDAQERAKKALEAARPKIAKLKIAVAAPGDAELSVTIDGEKLPTANLNVNRPIDPGEHTVEASAPGYVTARAKVRLQEGGVDSVALTLERDPNAVAVAPVPAPKPAGTPPPAAASAPTTPASPQQDTGATESPGAPNRVPAYVALGVGGAGLVLGTITGLVALGKKGALDDNCASKVCPPAEESSLDSTKTMATVSTIGFGVGLVGLAVGGYLWFSAPSSKSANKPSVTPVVGLGSLGLSGRF
jgi:hypothetical protein